MDVRRGVLHHVASGVISPPTRSELSLRLLGIHQGLVEVIREYEPTAVAVEDIFFARFPQGALKLGHARGVALLSASLAELPVSSYAPAQVKKAVTGHGRAAKGQIARLVNMLLKLDEMPREDQADALAIAICHAASSGWLVR